MEESKSIVFPDDFNKVEHSFGIVRYRYAPKIQNKSIISITEEGFDEEDILWFELYDYRTKQTYQFTVGDINNYLQQNPIQ